MATSTDQLPLQGMRRLMLTNMSSNGMSPTNGALLAPANARFGFPIGVTMVGLAAMVGIFFAAMAILMYCYMRILTRVVIRDRDQVDPTTPNPSPTNLVVEDQDKLPSPLASHPKFESQSYHNSNMLVVLTPAGHLTPSFIALPTPHQPSQEGHVEMV